MWLSYWTCWPMAKLLEVSVLNDLILFNYLQTSHAKYLDTPPEQLCAELQRAALVFIIWLQFWQGSRIFYHMTQYLIMGPMTSLMGPLWTTVHGHLSQLRNIRLSSLAWQGWGISRVLGLLGQGVARLTIVGGVVVVALFLSMRA